MSRRIRRHWSFHDDAERGEGDEQDGKHHEQVGEAHHRGRIDPTRMP